MPGREDRAGKTYQQKEALIMIKSKLNGHLALIAGMSGLALLAIGFAANVPTSGCVGLVIATLPAGQKATRRAGREVRP